MIREMIRQDLRKFWLVFSWKGLKITDRIKLWATEVAALIFVGTFQNKLVLVTGIIAYALFWWCKKTVSKKDMEELLQKLDDDEYGK